MKLVALLTFPFFMADLQKCFNLANGGERWCNAIYLLPRLCPFSVIYYSNDQDKKSQCSAHYNLLLCLFCTYLPVAFNFDNEIYSLVVNAKYIAYLSDKNDCLWPFPSIWVNCLRCHDYSIVVVILQINSCKETKETGPKYSFLSQSELFI